MAYLNTNKNLENYKELYRSKYFIDKSLIIDNLNLILKLRKLCYMDILNELNEKFIFIFDEWTIYLIVIF